MNRLYEFTECESCSSKPGTPALCPSCLSNRDVIYSLTEANKYLISTIKEIRILLDNPKWGS